MVKEVNNDLDKAENKVVAPVDTKVDTKTETKVKSKVESKDEIKKTSKSKAKSENKLKSDTKQETKVEAKTDPKADQKIEQKDEVKKTIKPKKEDSNEYLVFNKWSVKGINIMDSGLKDYINLSPRIVPKTNKKTVGLRFGKGKILLIERLMNKLFVTGHKGKKHSKSSGHQTGKTETVYNNVYKAFCIVEEKMKMNPVEVFIRAVENSAPLEEIVSIEYGGAKYPQAVECSPLRRIDIVLRMMTQGSYAKSFKSKKSIEQALAEEIMNAYNSNNASVAIAKKFELERQADASR